jgi:hypothetical protein
MVGRREVGVGDGGGGVSVSVGSGVDVMRISGVTEAILAVGELVYVLTYTAVTDGVTSGGCVFVGRGDGTDV